jgi:hypothetical protein
MSHSRPRSLGRRRRRRVVQRAGGLRLHVIAADTVPILQRPRGLGSSRSGGRAGRQRRRNPLGRGRPHPGNSRGKAPLLTKPTARQRSARGRGRGRARRHATAAALPPRRAISRRTRVSFAGSSAGTRAPKPPPLPLAHALRRRAARRRDRSPSRRALGLRLRGPRLPRRLERPHGARQGARRVLQNREQVRVRVLPTEPPPAAPGDGRASPRMRSRASPGPTTHTLRLSHTRPHPERRGGALGGRAS